MLVSRLLPGQDANNVTCEMLAESGVSRGDVRAFTHLCDLIEYYSSLKAKYREAARGPWHFVELYPDPPEPE